MISLANLATNALCRVNQITNRTLILPLLIFYPTSRCNSRCVSCDWWRSSGADDMTLEEIETLAGCLPGLGTRWVLLSGGEPLLRRDVFDIARCFAHAAGGETSAQPIPTSSDEFPRVPTSPAAGGIKLWLLTSGLFLEKYAEQVARHFSRVTVSLDASTAALYRSVRGVDALATVEAGVRQLKMLAPDLPVTARATLHRANYRELPHIVDKARAMELDGVSFLAADVSSTAFGRRIGSEATRLGFRVDSPAPMVGQVELNDLLLNAQEVAEFRSVVEEAATTHRHDFAAGFIAEDPAKLRRLPRYYAAMRGEESFPPVTCNAPWVSVVVEADGNVRPCFFHQSLGNVRHKPLTDILREDLPAFRRGLDVSTNPTCQRCVCSLNVSMRSNLW